MVWGERLVRLLGSERLGWSGAEGWLGDQGRGSKRRSDANLDCTRLGRWSGDEAGRSMSREKPGAHAETCLEALHAEMIKNQSGRVWM